MILTWLLILFRSRKPTLQVSTQDYFTPTSQIINLIKSLRFLAFWTSSPSTLERELANLKTIFSKNDYLYHKDDKLINKAIEGLKNAPKPTLVCGC